jgi:hypothetical protein
MEARVQDGRGEGEVRHAGAAALDVLEPVLREVRRLEVLSEKKRGIFYRKREAFLHFHEDDAGLFADLKAGGAYVRHRVSTAVERKRFLAAVRKAAAS